MTLTLRRLGRLAPPIMRQAGVYTASQLASRAIPFLLLPVLTRYLTPADYGIVTMFLFTTTILEPFISLGLAGAITVRYFDKATDLPAYLSTGFVSVAVAAAPWLLILVLVREPLADITAVPGAWVLLVVPLIVARSIVGTVLALLRVRGKAVVYAMFQNLQSSALFGLSLAFVVVLGLGWPGRVEAELAGWCGFAVIGVLWLWRGGWLRPAFVRSYAGQLARFGVPLIPHTLGAVLMIQTDRLLLTNLVSVDETGLYTVGYQLALVIELIAVSFNYAYTPWLFEQLLDIDDRMRRRLVRYTYLQFAVMGAIALAVAILMPMLAQVLLGRRFAGSERFVPWFALGFLFSGMYYMVTNYIFYVQRTGVLALVTITVGVTNIPLTYVLIQLNGGVGAAQAMAVSLGLTFVFTWIVSQRVHPMPWLHPREIARTPESRL